MKLTKIKLINWHFFINTSVEVQGNFLLTGENGCGKSTLTDAIYFVLSGGDDNCFNNAANADGKRTLKSYVRGKLGNEGDGKEFLRNTADVISHIALQYEDENDKFPMVLGATIEIVDDGKPKVKFYIVQNYHICDNDYIQEGKIVNFSELKNILKSKQVAFSDTKLNGSQRDRRKTIARDILKLDNPERYAELLRKAIAFKPINEVSTFVNNFLLKDNNIEIDALMEEIRSYREIKMQLDKEEQKVQTLETFVDKAEKYYENTKRLKFYEAIKVLLHLKDLEKKIKSKEKDYEKLVTGINIHRETLKQLDDKRSSYVSQRINLVNNELYKVLEEKKKCLSNVELKLNEISKKIDNVEKIISSENIIIKDLGLRYRFFEDIKNKNFGLFKEHVRSYKEDLQSLKDEKYRRLLQLEADISSIESNLHERQHELEAIEKGKNTYDKRTTTLIDLSKRELFKNYQKDVEVRPLCEYLEINDMRWANAIEGYLNTQRFDLIIEPNYYDYALEVYEKFKFDLNIYGVGIVRCDRAKEYDTNENTLFNKLNITNQYARFVAHMLLGNVVCVDSVGELKNYQTAITDTCMVYKNRTVRNIKPEIYEYPYVGSNSIIKRKNILLGKIEDLKAQKELAEKETINLKELIRVIESSKIKEIVDIEDLWKAKDVCMSEREVVQAEIDEVEKDDNIFTISETLKNVENELLNINNRINEEEHQKEIKVRDQGAIGEEIKKLTVDYQTQSEEYSKVCQKLDKIDYEKFCSNYVTEEKYDLRQVWEDSQKIQNSNNAMKSEIERGMREYVSKYSPSMSTLIENVIDFVNEYNKLKNRSLLDYKSRADVAFERCQSGFKTDFLSKLSERIEDAKDTLKSINKNLKDNPFGIDDEVYQFVYSSSDDDEMKDYYRIITSGKLLEANTFFDEVLDERDKDILKRLFDRIIIEKSGSESEKMLNRYLDYRNYMKFDIKTTNKYDNVSYFSKTNKEKSGGETQTPFYVIIATCFDQLILGDKNTSACTVIYDEAFNNMDESRINALMEFYKKLDIQLCIVVPSIRMATLTEYMDTVVGLTKINNRIFIQYIS